MTKLGVLLATIVPAFAAGSIGSSNQIEAGASLTARFDLPVFLSRTAQPAYTHSNEPAGSLDGNETYTIAFARPF